ncbi:MAG: PQQ-dependent sugar dehydrogenase [Maribacter sp.]|uniref:PQQ-dependent sugar dehydrogenase n=1 Tax=Maribacter sp. TaxID=1897614 RepID=UPI0032988913
MNRIFKISFVFLVAILSACNNSDDNRSPDPIPQNTIALQNAFPNLRFAKPLDLQSPSDGTDRVFVVEQGGTIKVFPNTETVSESTTFLDISNDLISRDELGLLGLAFHPNFGSNGLFYLAYTPSADLLVVSSFQVSDSDSNMANSSSETILLQIPQPFANHNGGQLAFGSDGYLYIASGDGGSGGDPQGNAQNLTNLLGKILRIDVDLNENGLAYAIPLDNPFLGNTAARDEIYAYGLRNPWRFSFDVQTNFLWAADVGQNAIEEINVIESGANYGWNTLEGTQCFNSSSCDTSGFEAPVFEYDQSANDRSITGGYVYRGQAIAPLQGLYMYADFISGRVWALSTNLGGSLTNQLVVESRLPISSFGTDANNELYICAFDGAIYKFVEN